MGLVVARKGRVVVLQPHGKQDVEAAVELEKAVLELIAAGDKYLVFDFSHTSLITSAALRVVLLAKRKLKPLEGKILLCAMSPTIRQVFDIAGLSLHFDIFATPDEAIGSMELVSDWGESDSGESAAP